MTEQFTLAEIRDACLRQEVRWADEAAQRLWDELRAVALIGAWASTCTQAGKLLEKHLQQQLQTPSGQIYRNLKRLPKSRSLDGTLESHLHVAGETLRVLRNRSAHPTGEISAQDATLAILCTLMLHGLTEFPHEAGPSPLASAKDAQADAIAGAWQSYTGQTIARRIARGSITDAIIIVRSANVSFYEYILRGISPLTLSRLPGRLGPAEADRCAFGTAILNTLPETLGILGRGRANGLQRFTRALGSATGLKHLRLLLLSLLPIDYETLENSFARSGGRLAWQLNDMRRSGHAIALTLGSDSGRSSELAIASWRAWDGTLAGANEIFIRARHSPPGLRKQLWAEAPSAAVLLHIRGSQQVTGMYRAFAYYVQDYERAADRSQFVAAFIERVNDSDLREKRQAFITLGQASALATPTGRHLAGDLMDGVRYDHMLESVRILATAGLYLRSTLQRALRNWLPHVPDEITEPADLLLIGWAALCSEAAFIEPYKLDRFFVPANKRFAYADFTRFDQCVMFLALEELEPGESAQTLSCWKAICDSNPADRLPRSAAWISDYLEHRGLPLPNAAMASDLPLPASG